MALALFDRVAAALFGGGAASPDDATERQLMVDMIELVVEAVEPRVRFHSGYQGKLEGCIRGSIAHLRAIGRQQLEPILLARTAWNDDPRLSAFFATVDEIPACLGRSNELRAFFENPSNSEIGEAYALLAMKKEERTVFAPQLEGGVVRHDVAQINVNFSQHTLIAPTATLAATRLEVGKRIIKRLAQVALSRIVALDMKATELQEHKAYLGARLRLLNLARDGMEGIVKDPATAKEEIKTLAMGKIQAATAGEQKLARNRRHAIVDRDSAASGGKNVRRHQSRRSRTDNRDCFLHRKRPDGNYRPTLQCTGPLSCISWLPPVSVKICPS